MLLGDQEGQILLAATGLAPRASSEPHSTSAVTQKMETPTVSIGLPVYNGESYLAQAISSLLGQTYCDLELVISDNASTDRTSKICRQFAERDHRVRYFRNDVNIGLPRNYQRVFHLSRGKYFKWAAHDDMHDPDFLRRCVEVLETNSEVILCYTRESIIDEDGRSMKSRGYGLDTSLQLPHERFRKILWIDLGSPPIFGLIRREVLAKTPLLGFNFAGDQVLLAELSLRGRFYEIPDPLLLHREHRNRSVLVYPSRHQLTVWLDPGKQGRLIFPSWDLFGEYLKAIARAPIGLRDRCYCAWEMLRWIRYRWTELLDDLRIAARQIFSGSTSRGPSA